MNPTNPEMPKPGCFFVIIVMMLAVAAILSYWLVGTFNPAEVYRHGTAKQLVILCIPCVFAAFALLGSISAVRYHSTKRDPRLNSLAELCVFCAITLGVSYFLTGDVNPVAVYWSQNAAHVLVNSTLLIITAFAGIKWLFMVIIIALVEKAHGQSFRDVYCKLCPHPLFPRSAGFNLAVPMPCQHCQKWVHRHCLIGNGGASGERCKPCQTESIEEGLQAWEPPEKWR